jgi:nitroimidazol reductase NimA-like FMN-containing flavoprotein (pyridoxamine 5'-phosphate oxidase superfamily)
VCSEREASLVLVDEGLELLDEDVCFELLAQAEVGRLALSIGALPAVFPVNYVLDDGSVVFRTAPGTKLTAAINGAVVAFEVDEFQSQLRSGWSVLAVGRASVVTDPAELGRLAHLHISPWAGGDRQWVVRVPVEMISGRRILREVR